MAEIEQIRVSIKRPKDGLDGKVIGYIRSNPFGLETDYSQVITTTLKNHWLPLALFSSGLRGEELRQIGIWAISQLEAQISLIRRTCGIAPDPLVVTSNISAQASNIVASDSLSVLGIISGDGQISSAEDEEQDNEDDDDFISPQKNQEMTEIKRMFGWNNQNRV
ncbi:hypothetical protein I8752_11155 [Nostocaceae cyanobacterium CENA369]|uniref:Uncharacterized protein n=1 Tax=Dendronalium phyllosphericum CENA369 TaxID=1725256 RepID=A0A8J7I5S8_9NOST|nr:hypothetical protein [Dendronalium phyllosphericum]MBH8573561.1 hypothetical protein [Dendronalium phyllosphericum CENA369]